MNIYEKLAAVQQELKAPKDKKNTFGGYSYRSAEGILEAVKPLLKKYELNLILTDSIEETSGRIYVKSTAWLLDPEGKCDIKVTAFAREAETKRGMDDSQITGTASSYARKYALNGLLLIDDTKDADTDEYQRQTTSQSNQSKVKTKPSVYTESQKRDADDLRELAKKAKVPEGHIITQAGVRNLEDMDPETFAKVKAALLNKIKLDEQAGGAR